MQVRLVETGEELDYRLAEIFDARRTLLFATDFDLVAATAQGHPNRMLGVRAKHELA